MVVPLQAIKDLFFLVCEDKRESVYSEALYEYSVLQKQLLSSPAVEARGEFFSVYFWRYEKHHSVPVTVCAVCAEC